MIGDKGTYNLIGGSVHMGGEMGGVYVHPGYQRKGYGTIVINNLLDIALEQKLPKIWLDATPFARPLYLKLGFIVINPCVMFIEGKPLNYFKMEKFLS